MEAHQVKCSGYQLVITEVGLCVQSDYDGGVEGWEKFERRNECDGLDQPNTVYCISRFVFLITYLSVS